MWQYILPSLITGGLALAGTVFSNMSNHSKTMYRIEQLEKKQDKHNSLIERMYAVEKSIDLLEQREKVSEHRIDDLEKEK